MPLPQSWLWGLVPGLVTASVGAYKDTLFEEFDPVRFFRSPVIALAWYVAIDRFYRRAPVLLKIGLASTLERVTVETYKAVIRHPPGKFSNCRCAPDGVGCLVSKDRGWLLDRLDALRN